MSPFSINGVKYDESQRCKKCGRIPGYPYPPWEQAPANCECQTRGKATEVTEVTETTKDEKPKSTGDPTMPGSGAAANPLTCPKHGEPWGTIYKDGAVEYDCGCEAEAPTAKVAALAKVDLALAKERRRVFDFILRLLKELRPERVLGRSREYADGYEDGQREAQKFVVRVVQDERETLEKTPGSGEAAHATAHVTDGTSWLVRRMASNGRPAFAAETIGHEPRFTEDLTKAVRFRCREDAEEFAVEQNLRRDRRGQRGRCEVVKMEGSES